MDGDGHGKGSVKGGKGRTGRRGREKEEKGRDRGEESREIDGDVHRTCDCLSDTSQCGICYTQVFSNSINILVN